MSDATDFLTTQEFSVLTKDSPYIPPSCTVLNGVPSLGLHKMPQDICRTNMLKFEGTTS